jgi:ethylbenzene dioxygenase ferredoxin subunit
MTSNSLTDIGDRPLIRLCESTVVADGEALRVEIDGMPAVAVYNVGGEFFVTDDTCTHGSASLSDGFLEGTEIECPWHSGRFCIRTGRALAFPAVQSIRVYPVTIEGTSVLIPKPDGSDPDHECAAGHCHTPASEVTQ